MIEGLQQANISLDKGIVRTPSLGVGGELSECVNLIPHAGEMVRIHEPQPITEDVTGQYLYYTTVFEPLSRGGSLSVVLSESITLDVPVKVVIRISEDEVMTDDFVVDKGNTYSTMDYMDLESLDNLISIEVGSEELIASLKGLGYNDFSAHRPFEYTNVSEVEFPTNIPLELQDGEILLAVNRCAGKENLIVRSGNSLVHYRPSEGRYLITTLEDGEVEVVTIGQTLVVSQGTTKRYFVWNSKEYKEQNFWESIPKVELRLGGKGFTPEYVIPKGTDISTFYTYHWKTGPSEMYYDWISSTERYIYWFPKEKNNESNAEELNQSFWGAYNEIRESFKKHGAHCFPFYVRWGIELYDNSIVNLSAPILMTPSSVIRPWVGYFNQEGSTLRPGEKVDAEMSRWTIGFTPRNLYITIDASELKELDSALIKGVVIYATPEIEAVDTEFEIFQTGKYRIFEYKSDTTKDALGWDTQFKVTQLREGATVNIEPKHFNFLNYLPLKTKATRNIVQAFNDPVEFYELGNIPWEVIKDKNYKVVASLQEGKLPQNKEDEGENIIPTLDPVYAGITSKGYAPYLLDTNLKALASQGQLASRTITQENYIIASANSTYSYNSRLFYGGVNLKLPLSLNSSQILANNKIPDPSITEANESISLSVNIGDSYLSIDGGDDLVGYRGESPAIAFPHPDAKGLAVYAKEGGWAAKVTFQKDKFSLGGYSIWSGITEELIKANPDIKGAFLVPSEVGDEWKSDSYRELKASDIRGNTIAITKAENPWIIETLKVLACGEIYALSSATEAVSEGQFGQFPIYAFTDNGIYALSIDSEGTIEAKQAISRDVLSQGSKVLQLDKALVFATKAGLKLLSKPPCVLLSDVVSGPNVKEEDFDAPKGLTISDTLPFEEQIQDAQMVYDYAHQMIHVFGGDAEDGKQKHYVYDLESGQWATQILDKQLTTCVAGYPFSTLQFGRQLMQYNNELEADVVKQGWLLTRPISFNDPFTRKMLADIRLLGQKTNTDTKFKVQVYISEDRVKWHRLTSLKGRSAKWYRFLIKADMCGLDTLTGITCQYVPRLGNKLR